MASAVAMALSTGLFAAGVHGVLGPPFGRHSGSRLLSVGQSDSAVAPDNFHALIAEDGPFAAWAIDASYHRWLAAALLPEQTEALQYVSEGSTAPEESLYVTRALNDEDHCMLTSVRLKASMKSAYGREWVQRERAGFRGVADIALPEASKVVRSLPSQECQRLEAVWKAALSKLQTLSDWANYPVDCRDVRNKCETIFPLPHASLRCSHYSIAVDVGRASGYLIASAAKGDWLRLETLSRALIEYVRASDASNQKVAYVSMLEALTHAEGSYAKRPERSSGR